ncbi:MAG: acetyl-CoA carboxylase [Elusimicrobiota bacterium]|jgi:acetyl-CoA carboxylase biotin carboxyl carrier protein
MTENRLDTIEIEEPALKMRLVRRRDPAQIPVPVFTGGPAPAARPANQPAEAAMPSGVTAVRSSMMGIFYRAPTPSSPPFTKEGDSVKAGQVLCVIEAMKVFNELKAETSGTMLKVLVENGKPVKAGQDIFWIQQAQ